MKKRSRNILLLAIIVISTLMHLEHFPKDLMSFHVWRQTQTQSTIINFYEEDMNILNPRRNDRGDEDGIFRMEFPLMQWLVACQYKLFGNHLIISRLFMFIIGIGSILGIYKLLQALFQNTTLAIMGAWAFNFSPSFYYYTINPLPDNMALCCSIWGLALFFSWVNSQKISQLLLSGIFLSIGALCKLPFIMYYIVPFVYFTSYVFKRGFKAKSSVHILGVFILSILPIAWYLSVIPNWGGNPVVKGMFDNKDSVTILLGYFWHNLISTIPELLLNYGSVIFFLAGLFFLFKKRAYRSSKFVLVLSLSIVVLVYYILEANAIGTVHDYYLFPFYPLLFMLVGYGAFYMYKSKVKFIRFITVFALCILPVTCYLRMEVRWNPDSPGFNKDLLIYKEELRQAVPKDALVVAGNDESHFIFFYYIDKKGWGYHNDELSGTQLFEMIDRGAEYLYTDSKELDANEELISAFDSLVVEKGSIKVYRLKKASEL